MLAAKRDLSVNFVLSTNHYVAVGFVKRMYVFALLHFVTGSC